MGGWYIPAPASPTGTAPMLLHVLRPEYMYGAYEDVDVDVGCFVFMFKVHTTLVGHVSRYSTCALISVWCAAGSNRLTSTLADVALLAG